MGTLKNKILALAHHHRRGRKSVIRSTGAPVACQKARRGRQDASRTIVPLQRGGEEVPEGSASKHNHHHHSLFSDDNYSTLTTYQHNDKH